VKLFAALREQRGAREVELELEDGSRVDAVWPALGLGDEPAGLVYAVNRSYATRDAVLAEGDEVALIPPVSGGAFRLSDEPLSLERVVAEVASDDAGAIATFVGTTRAQSRGREVVRLEYEAYAGMAEGATVWKWARLRLESAHARSRQCTACVYIWVPKPTRKGICTILWLQPASSSSSSSSTKRKFDSRRAFSAKL